MWREEVGVGSKRGHVTSMECGPMKIRCHIPVYGEGQATGATNAETGIYVPTTCRNELDMTKWQQLGGALKSSVNI